MSKTLFLIPARAGSKGLPQKNIKNLCGKPLISYSIEFALQNCNSNDVICISTNDLNVIDIATKQYQIDVPFIRSEELSSDKASTYDVLIDALKYYEKNDCFFEKILLLQPTSPYRIQSDFEKINELYNNTEADMVVSVKKSKESPYFTLFEENKKGYLNKILENSLFTNRQDCPPVYTYNGSMYLVNAKKFIEKKNFNFQKIVKYEMPESRSIDIDTQLDWVMAEYYQNSYNENN